MKKGIALIAALVLSVLLLGCEEAVTYATADDAKAALNGQGVITIDGDFSEPNQASDIRVNNGFAGFMRETGLINGKWTISANYEEWFYAKYVTDEPVNHQEGVNSGSTLGFYDMDGNCLGYAQERVDANWDNAYIVYFLDPDFAPSDCTLRRTARRCGTTAKPCWPRAISIGAIPAICVPSPSPPPAARMFPSLRKLPCMSNCTMKRTC